MHKEVRDRWLLPVLNRLIKPEHIPGNVPENLLATGQAFPEQTDLAKNCPEDNVPPDKRQVTARHPGRGSRKDNKDPVGAAKAAKSLALMHNTATDVVLKAARLKRVNRAVSVQIKLPSTVRLPM